MGHVSRKHCEEIMMKFMILMPLDRFWKLVFVERDILDSGPQETLFLHLSNIKQASSILKSVK
jgi:hypothetical protein